MRSQTEIIRWYTGDVEGTDPFWGDPKAYVAVNALFFPGIHAEERRAAEGKRLNPAILADAERLLAVLGSLCGAFRPYPAPLLTSRVERYADYTEMRRSGGTLSFTSTSTAGFLPAYADRRGIALMQFSLPAGTPCIRMAEALPHYAKSDEAEVLLPPRLGLRLTEQPLTEDNPAYVIRDADGKPPLLLVTAEPAAPLPLPPQADAPADGNLAGMRVFEALNRGAVPDAADKQDYTRWKAAFLLKLFSKSP